MTQIESWAQELVREAVAAEREACAKIAEEHWEPNAHQFPKQIAAAIRARGQQC